MFCQRKNGIRVLAISHNWPHEDDPSCGIFMDRQMRGLRELGADITVLVPLAYVPGFMSRFERYKLFRPRKPVEYAGIYSKVFRFFRLPGSWAERWDGLSCYLSMQRWVKRQHKRKKFDVIYSRCLIPEGDIGIRLSRLLDIPVLGVGIGHDANILPSLSSSLNRHFVWVLKNLNTLMATGHQVADVMKQASGRDVFVLAGVVDLNKFSPTSQKDAIRSELGLPKDDIILLFVGHLEKNKGIFELVDVFEKIHDCVPNLKLFFCGDGIHSRELREYINDRKMQHHIKTVGVVVPDKVSAWMQASDIFVLPTHHEGMPNVVMEAMACGLPVVSTSVGGLPASVGDCDGVILVQPRNCDEIKDSLLKLVRDGELRSRMAGVSRQWAEDHFGIEANSKKLLQYLERCIDEYDLAKPHNGKVS